MRNKKKSKLKHNFFKLFVDVVYFLQEIMLSENNYFSSLKDLNISILKI